jgi:hypothetical protein
MSNQLYSKSHLETDIIYVLSPAFGGGEESQKFIFFKLNHYIWGKKIENIRINFGL